MASPLREFDYNLSQHLTPVVKWIIYICSGVFVLQILFADLMIIWFAARPATTIFRGYVWQFFTYAFLHGGIFHLLFNLIAIYFFGRQIETRWSSGTFLRFVLFVAAGSVATHLLVTTTRALTGPDDYLYVPIIGISGVVYGLILVYALYYPDQVIMIYGILPVKMKHLAIVLGFVAFAASYDHKSQIAHLTHLGGFLFGYIFYRAPHFFDKIPLPPLGRRAPQKRDPWRDY